MGSRQRVEQGLSEDQLSYLDTAYVYHKPVDEDIVSMYQQMRVACRHLAAMIMHLPPGREQSIALTNLEQVNLWANSSIARNQDLIVQKLAERRGETDEPEEG